MLNNSSSKILPNKKQMQEKQCQLVIDAFLVEYRNDRTKAHEILCYVLLERKFPNNIQYSDNLQAILRFLLEGKVERFIIISIAKVIYDFYKDKKHTINWGALISSSLAATKLAYLYFLIIDNAKTEIDLPGFPFLRKNNRDYSFKEYQYSKDKNLKRLKNTVCRVFIRLLALFLKINMPLSTLRLDDVNVDDSLLITLAKGIKKNCFLRDLNLACNSISSNGVEVLSSAITQHPTLTVLDLRDNLIDDRGVEIIKKNLAQNSTLTRIAFGGNPISSKGVKMLGELLEKNKAIKIFVFPQVYYEAEPAFGIDEKGADALSWSLLQHETLEMLDLRNNNIGYKGAQSFAVMLALNTKIISIIFDDNQLTDLGGKYIAEAMGYNETLEELHLMGNRLGNETAEVFAKILRENVNTKLKLLNLTENNIDDRGAKLLATAIMTNSTLHTLELRRNLITDEGAIAILQALQFNTSLITLNIPLNQNSMQTLVSTLEVNFTLQHISIFIRNQKEKLLASKIEILLKRNQLIAKYPEYQGVIKMVCLTHQLYQSSTQPKLDGSDCTEAAKKKFKVNSFSKSPLSLKNIVGFFIAEQRHVYTDEVNENLPSDLIEFINRIKAFKQETIERKLLPHESQLPRYRII